MLRAAGRVLLQGSMGKQGKENNNTNIIKNNKSGQQSEGRVLRTLTLFSFLSESLASPVPLPVAEP